MRAQIEAISLSDFRSYGQATLRPEGRSVYLFGPNGAGKTNLLEALSLLSPGRGLRNAVATEVGRREPEAKRGLAWAVSAQVISDDGLVRLGTGLDGPGATRRRVRIEGETVAPGRLLEHLRLTWLTPGHDRLFLEARSDRLRFFDRLVFADWPAHATAVGAYEKALRERLKLLCEGPSDPDWLSALEVRLAEAGAAMAEARVRTLLALQTEIDSRSDRPFPQAQLSLTGETERAALAGPAQADLSGALQAGFAHSRGRDQAAGRSLFGPHRCDFQVLHRLKNRPAAECSTGEQKTLLLNLVLAQGARLSRAKTAPNPVILLDEVAAHLDRTRRGALFEETTRLGLQAFFTGTDEGLFDDLKGHALGVRVDAGTLTLVDG